MLKFELHCHSSYSKGMTIPCEGIPRPEDIVRRAKKLGLSGIAITDHSSIEAWKPAAREAKKYGLMFIPGIELETPEGQVIGLGVSEYIEENLPLEEAIERVREQGGLAIAPHPFDLRGHGMRNHIVHADAVEVFNALCSDKLANWFAKKKALKLGKPMLCGSDAHTLNMLGKAVNLADAQDTDSLLREIKKGRLRMQKDYIPISDIVEWNRQRFTMSYDYLLGYMKKSYSSPRLWVSKGLLDTFIQSKSRFWTFAARFSLPFIRAYGLLRLLKYY